jgi:glycosyltransferase involved in cell wall biosynthesis
MISIIIPTYNRGKLIIETIDSIINQSYKNWECIIVDDDSSDDSYTTICDYTKKDSRFRIYKRPEFLKKGASGCRNFAFKLANGTFIQFFDSDDIMHPNHLINKISIIEDADFVVCKLREFAKTFNQKLFLENDFDEDFKYEENVFEAFVMGRFPMMMVAPMWKKEALEPYMPIREDMSILEDHELFARALFHTKKYKIVDKTRIYYRVELTSLTNNFYANLANGIDSYFEAKKTVLRLSDSNKIKLAILKMTLGFFRLGLAQKKYSEAEKCLYFIRNEKLCYSGKLKVKLIRISLFYLIFKLVGRGDTKFKPLLKI